MGQGFLFRFFGADIGGSDGPKGWRRFGFRRKDSTGRSHHTYESRQWIKSQPGLGGVDGCGSYAITPYEVKSIRIYCEYTRIQLGQKCTQAVCILVFEMNFRFDNIY
jgi:hypothetical protein